jgi:acetylornithine deacetylase
MEPSGPTLNVGVLQGGTARNVIAPEARLLWEIRFRAGDDVHQLLDDALARVRARLRRSFGARFDLLQLATQELATIPAFDAGPGGAAETLVRSLGAQGRPLAVPYGAEAGQYQAAGISTVICGPGSIEQAHQANEYIELAQVQACDALIDRLVHWAREVRLEA